MTQKPPQARKDDPHFRILCVDDNPMFQKMLKIALGTYGFEVITASDGIDALMQYKAHAGRFGAIISDHDMPRMNGLGFVRAVREAGYKGRIVIMSGRLTVEELREYEPYAISGFFHKPFEVSLLAAMFLQGDSHPA
jgi:CheY-like chemotaxis protein